MRIEEHQRSAKWAYAAVALVCIGLVVFTGSLAAIHVHAGHSRISSHPCSVCALAHSGIAPAALGSDLPVLVRTRLIPTSSQTLHSLLVTSAQFIRPPPLG